MPLTDNSTLNNTSRIIVETLRTAFETPEGVRPAHAKGALVRGHFTPTKEAADLSIAPHFNCSSTPVIVRFSNSTGKPHISDTDPQAGPWGAAIRFVFSDDGHKHTDLVGHSTPYFPMRTGDDFLQMLQAIGNGTIASFLEANPSAAAFVNDPKPHPVSFATNTYYMVSALKVVDSSAKYTYVRFRLVPEAGRQLLSEAEVKIKSDSYLFEELPNRLSTGPVRFKLVAQIAEEGDVTDDATVHWPEDRALMDFRLITLHSMGPEEDGKREQQRLIFDVVPRVTGLETSADPLYESRSSVYLQSGRIRRAANPDQA